jgi:integrase
MSLIAPSESFQKVGNWFEFPLDFDTSGQQYIDTELALIYGFLHEYKESISTQKNYAKELEKLIQWSWRIKSKSIFKMSRVDILAYIDFLKSPPATWVGTTARPKFILVDGAKEINPRWRPFVSKDKWAFVLSTSALSASLSILQSFYNWLIEDQHTDVNPISLIRQKKALLVTDKSEVGIRRITNFQWDYTVRAAKKLAEKNPRVHERSLFVISIMYSMYVRISDLAPYKESIPRMTDFFRDDSGWWFLARGKGNKKRRIGVSDETLDLLKRYRRSLGLPPLPTPADKDYLFPALRSDGKPYLATTRQFQRMLKPIFDKAYSDMIEDGLEDDASELLSASAHWMRHTGISEDVKHRPREHVRDDAGHSSTQTTDKYISADFKERNSTSKYKKIISDE